MENGEDRATAPSHESNTNGSGSDRDDYVRTVATIGVIGVGAALIEVGLIPGMIIGVAAAYAPKYLPQIGTSLQPMFKSAVRGAYKLSRKTRDAVAEAKEQVNDIVAEVHAEDTQAGAEAEMKPRPQA